MHTSMCQFTGLATLPGLKTHAWGAHIQGRQSTNKDTSIRVF